MIHPNYSALDDKKLKELDPEIEKWKDQDFDPILLSVDLDEHGEFEGIFRTPSEEILELLNTSKASGRKSDNELARMCVLYPDPVTFGEIIERFWGMTTPLSKKLLERSHVTKEAKVKKL